MKIKFFSMLIILLLITIYTNTKADITCGGSSNEDNSRGAYSCTLTDGADQGPFYGGDSYIVPGSTTVYYTLHADANTNGSTEASLGEPTPINVYASSYYGYYNTTSGSAYNDSEQWFDLWVSGANGTSYVTISWANN